MVSEHSGTAVISNKKKGYYNKVILLKYNDKALRTDEGKRSIAYLKFKHDEQKEDQKSRKKIDGSALSYLTYFGYFDGYFYNNEPLCQNVELRIRPIN